MTDAAKRFDLNEIAADIHNTRIEWLRRRKESPETAHTLWKTLEDKRRFYDDLASAYSQAANRPRTAKTD